MNKKFTHLPPMTSLQGFEAAARLGSFSRAAEELNLTQSAVSHQIRTLEDHFGQKLFHRVGRTIELTDAGFDFHETVTEVLNRLDQGSRRLSIYANEASVVLFTSQSLAARWLTPILSALRKAHPDVDPWIASFYTVPELSSAEAHLAITTSMENQDGWVSDILFQDARVPLCDNRLVTGQTPVTIEMILSQHPLLHDETATGWAEWFAANGIETSAEQPGTSFSEPALALDAAVHSQGIVLGSVILGTHDIMAKRLVPLSPHLLETDETYRLFCREESLSTPAVAAMRAWILREAEITRAQLAALNLYPFQH